MRACCISGWQRMGASLICCLAVMLVIAPRAHAGDLIEQLKQPGQIVLMRHALAPLEGAPKSSDPGANNLDDCATQRNLNDVGRAQARRLRGLFEAAGVRFDAVYASAYCRCRETADLLTGVRVPVLEALTSTYLKPDKGPEQMAKMLEFIGQLPLETRILLVTHGSLIESLSGIEADNTEIVVLKRGGEGKLEVVGRGLL